MLLLARYILPVSAPHIEDGGVLVRDGEIVAVGLRSDLLAAYPNEEVRDYGLAALMPGFVDLHTHFEYATFRGVVNDAPYSQWKMQVMSKEAELTPDDWDESAVLGAIESIRSGITTIADVTVSGTSIAPTAQAGLRGVIYREVSTMDRSQVGGVVSAALDDVVRWQERVDPALVTIGLAPHSPYSCHPTLFKAVADAAGERDLPVAIHLAGSRDEYDFIKYGSSSLGQDYRAQSGWGDVVWLPTGVSPVQYVYQWGILEVPNVLAVHCVHLDSADVDTLARNDVAIAYCARCNLKLGMGIAPLQAFISHDIRVGIGTDSPASNSTVDFFDEMRIGLLVQRGLAGEAQFYTSERFVRMATLEGARALKIDHLVGSLEAGKRADIIAVDLSRSHQVPTQDPYS
ncbi:MAG: amidohydrolase family protein, partial [Actinomycetota bacterium]|nr:amidohydrolase family protein [Actinomycetota bacterium]